MTDFTIWTDGGCSINPNGKGGYGVVIQHNDTGDVNTLSQGFKSTTNNRMEIRAVIAALSELPNHSSAILYSDSRYVVMTMTGVYSKKKNRDLWQILDEIISSADLDITFEWVKGHEDNHNNNVCDELATDAMHQDDNMLIEDDGFVPIEPKENIEVSDDLSMFGISVNPLFPDGDKDCFHSICEINSTNCTSFQKFAQIKEPRDFWSLQTLPSLRFYFGEYLYNYILLYCNAEHDIESVFRWYGRGFTIENAIRKTMVDHVIHV